MNALDTINGRPKVKASYEALLAVLAKVGEHELEVKKTSLHVTHGRAFLGIHPRSTGLVLNLVTDMPLESSRVRKSEQLSRNRCHNEVVVTSESDLDEELTSWIRLGYALTVNFR